MNEHSDQHLSAGGETPVSEAAWQMLDQALLWDSTLPWTTIGGQPWLFRSMLDRMAAVRYNVVSLTIGWDGDTPYDTLRRIAVEWQHIRRYPDKYQLVGSVEEIAQAQAAGKLALYFHFQGTRPFGREIGMVELYYRLGVRHALIAFNQMNHAGCGCHERVDGGLSRWGVELVREMNRVGMLVDCTHTGYKTSRDVFEVATGPVIFSHSNARALTDHERNIPDNLAVLCAGTGGVVGINGVGIFLGNNSTTAASYFRHLDHFVQLIGPEHVGIGLDCVSDPSFFLAAAHENAERYPSGQNYEIEVDYSVPERIPEVVELMLKAGYGDDAIRSILGGNWLRLAKAVWK